MDLKIIEKPLFFLWFFNILRKALEAYPMQGQTRKSLPKAGPSQKKPIRKACPRQCQTRKSLPKAGPSQQRPTQGRPSQERPTQEGLPGRLPWPGLAKKANRRAANREASNRNNLLDILGALALAQRVNRWVASCWMDRGGRTGKPEQQNAGRTRNLYVFLLVDRTRSVDRVKIDPEWTEHRANIA